MLFKAIFEPWHVGAADGFILVVLDWQEKAAGDVHALFITAPLACLQVSGWVDCVGDIASKQRPAAAEGDGAGILQGEGSMS